MMNTTALQNWQFQSSDIFGELNLPVFEAVIQIYRNTVTKAGRVIILILKIMSTHVDAIILQPYIGSTEMLATTAFIASGALVELATNISVNYPNPMTPESLNVALDTAVTSYATGQSYIVDNISHIIDPSAAYALSSAPQPAIADCPADAVTTYNVITTLLGSLTGAVNTANTKQNDIATKLNTLFSELRTLKIIAP